MSEHVDGNAVLGAFREVLGVDVSVAVLTCAGCGSAAPFAEHHAYDRAPGLVLRCASCAQVTARLVRAPDAVWLDLRGARSWRIPLEPA
jgi:hypothetical protein